MHNHYIINGFIEFHPAASTLRNLNDPENVVVLNSPAGRCLLLLIKRNDTIVTQQEFMEIVWEKNGMLVSPNTFYQNISILRKGLKKIGLPEDTVVTIPRVGLTLASGTEIKKRSSEKLITIGDENSHVTDENTVEQDPHYQDSLPGLPDAGETARQAKMPPEAPLVAKPEKIAPSAFSVTKKSAFFIIIWGGGLIAMILLILAVSLNNIRSQTHSFFEPYHLLTNVNGCHIYIADKNTSPDDMKRILSLVENFKTSCIHYPWIYVTYYFMLQRISVIRCNKQMSEPNSCVSEYYFRGLR